jgi:hypothetical protein
MALSALNVLSGISAAVAGLAGEKVTKDGNIPGIDLAALVPALLGNKTGGAAGVLGTLASVAAKTGLLNSSNLANLPQLAGSLFSSGKEVTVKKTDTTAGGVAGLAAAIMGSSGKGADLASIASLASGLAGSAKNQKEVTTIAADLGKTLSNSFGLSFDGGSTALKALDKVVKNDTEGSLLKSVLKGLV